MRPWYSQHRVMCTVTILALASAICGASPQEGRVQRPLPQQQPQQQAQPRSQPSEGRATRPAPSPSTDQGSAATPRAQAQEDRRTRQASEGRSAHQDPSRRVLEQPRPTGGMKLAGVQVIGGTRLVIPPAWKRCGVLPDRGYWQHRDLMAEIQWLSRRGFIPVTALGDGVDSLTDFAQTPAGWRAYGLAVPAGGTVQVEVQHEKLGWFRLMLVDKWGTPGPGMLQAAIAHQPVLVTYTNPGKEATAVYVIVDDPAWWSDAKYPYTLMVRRDWDPASVDLGQVKMVAGLWGATPSVSAEFRGRSLTGPAVFPR